MEQRKDYISWDEAFMTMAKVSAMRSKDPSSQVGAVIVDDTNHILSVGYNGAPNGFNDDIFPWAREGEALNTKYLYVCHAEMNALSNFNGNKTSLKGAKIYVTLFPCSNCSKLIVQNGITEVIFDSDKYAETIDNIASKRLLDTCGIKYRQYNSQVELINKKDNEPRVLKMMPKNK